MGYSTSTACSPIPLSAADSWMEHDYPWLPSVSTDTSTLPTGDVHYDYGLHAARMIHHLRDVVTMSPEPQRHGRAYPHDRRRR
ncbi:hypothetical protein B0H10DRAFT_2127917 [Mycena sp. CBHHK59/15]|nr:hypothetical protein B0H10DRAFT_2127917 [Mycena sp. CBHHK59/15]